VSLPALRQQIADVLSAGASSSPGLPTGLAALDAALPGGLPRGRLTEIVGARGSGVTTLVRTIVARAIADGSSVAYVDATRTLAPRDWAALALPAGPRGEPPLWMVRPTDATRAAWCADVLLRSGAFSLVVLDGAPTLSRAIAVRLTRLARDADATLVVVDGAPAAVGARATQLGGAVRLRVERAFSGVQRGTLAGERRERRGPRLHDMPALGRTTRTPTIGLAGGGESTTMAGAAEVVRVAGAGRGTGVRQVQFAVVVEKGGTYRTVEVCCAIDVARRLCTHSEIPDRRGVARDRGRRQRAERVEPAAARAAAGHAVHVDAGYDTGHDGSAVPARPRGRRRCAEPDFGRAPIGSHG
jgi:hypothetical protein